MIFQIGLAGRTVEIHSMFDKIREYCAGYLLPEFRHPDLRTEITEEDMEREERRKMIDETLASLPRREEEILKMFYGLDSVEDTTLKDIGEDLRLSRERVRQIKNKTLRRLQKSKEHKDKLSDFLEH